MSNKLHTDRKLKKFKAGRRNLARKIAVTSSNFFKDDVFNAQGFIDNTTKKWKPRKKGSGSKILVKTGRGRRSIRPTKITNREVVITANAPYMKYHNDGTKRMPRRQFMGNSNKLDKKNLKLVLDFIDDL